MRRASTHIHTHTHTHIPTHTPTHIPTHTYPHTHTHTHIPTHTYTHTHPHTHPHYCNSLLTDIPKIQEKRLNKIINQTCRLIFKLSKRTHTTYYRKKLKCLTFKNRSIYKTLNIIHTAINLNLPKYIRNSIDYKETTNLRSSNSILLKHNTLTNYSLLWNKLPKTIINEKLPLKFKTKLHRYLLELN